MTRWRRSPLPPGWDTRIRPAILNRDDWLCQIRGPRCTTVATEVDHIDGHDDHSPENLQSACGRCHRTKTGLANAARLNARRHTRGRPVAKHPGLIDRPPPPRGPRDVGG